MSASFLRCGSGAIGCIGRVDDPEALRDVRGRLRAGELSGGERRPRRRELVVGPVHRLGEVRDLDLLVGRAVGVVHRLRDAR